MCHSDATSLPSPQGRQIRFPRLHKESQETDLPRRPFVKAGHSKRCRRHSNGSCQAMSKQRCRGIGRPSFSLRFRLTTAPPHSTADPALKKNAQGASQANPQHLQASAPRPTKNGPHPKQATVENQTFPVDQQDRTPNSGRIPPASFCRRLTTLAAISATDPTSRGQITSRPGVCIVASSRARVSRCCRASPTAGCTRAPCEDGNISPPDFTPASSSITEQTTGAVRSEGLTRQ